MGEKKNSTFLGWSIQAFPGTGGSGASFLVLAIQQV